MKSEPRSASRVGQGGRPYPKERWPSSRNLCSTLEVLVMKPLLCKAEDGEGLVLLHDRLVKAAVEIEATTTSSRYRKNCVLEEIRQMAANECS